MFGQQRTKRFRRDRLRSQRTSKALPRGGQRGHTHVRCGGDDERASLVGDRQHAVLLRKLKGQRSQ